jgi:hypothetical protein
VKTKTTQDIVDDGCDQTGGAMTSSPPLHGFLWNQAELPSGDPLHEALVMLLVTREDLSLQLVGTGFIVAADGGRATAISAAHCFEEVRKVLHPHSPHHLSTPREFLPTPKEIDLKQVKALYTKATEVHTCAVELAIWDSATDLAVLNITAPDDNDQLFTKLFWIDDVFPSVNEKVAMIGYGNMEVIPDETRQQYGTIKRQLILRLGTVEGVHPEGFYMLKAPCVETTIPIYSGMSGGLVARWGSPDTQIQPFAFISHAPEPQPIDDRSLSGHSVGSILNATRAIIAEKKQRVQIQLNNIGLGRTNSET